MIRSVVLILWSAILIFSFNSLLYADYTEVTADGNRLQRLAVVPPQPLGNSIRPDLANQVAELLVFDLTMSGLFTAERKDAPLLSAGLALTPIDFNPWQSAGFDLLLRGEYELRGEELTLELRLYDVTSKKLLATKRYLGKEGELRRYGHNFSDEILQVVSGERGSFSSKIVFVSNQTGNKEIYSMDWDGFDVRQLTSNRSISISPDVSPDGKSLLYTSYKKGNPDLYRRSLPNGSDHILSNRKGLNITGAWSPDSSKVALTLSKDGNSEIYLISADGASPNRLTVSQSANLSPAWKPDGGKMAFVSDRQGNPQIFIMDANGGNVSRLITAGSYNVNPAWSPKGDRIAFARRSNGFQIFVANADGSSEIQLTFEGNNERPRWSPDGRLITFSSRRDGQEGVYMMRSDGSGQIRVSRVKGLAQHPVWWPVTK